MLKRLLARRPSGKFSETVIPPGLLVVLLEANSRTESQQKFHTNDFSRRRKTAVTKRQDNRAMLFR